METQKQPEAVIVSAFQFNQDGEPVLDVAVPKFSVDHFMAVLDEVEGKP